MIKKTKNVETNPFNKGSSDFKINVKCEKFIVVMLNGDQNGKTS